MAKRRASLRGRGAEILLGTPAAAESEPQPVEAASTETEAGGADAPGAKAGARAPDESAEAEPILDDEEVERALEEEARAAGPSPEEEVAFSVEPVDEELPDMVPPAADEALELPEEAAIYEAPLPEVSDVVSGVLPPRPGQTPSALGEDVAVAYDIQEPEDTVEPIELPDRELTEKERAQIMDRLGDERIRTLEEAIDEAYEGVRLEVGDNRDITTECYNQLLKARDIILRRDAANIAQAEYYVESVRARLRRAAESEAAARKYQWPILIWGLLWFAAFLTLLILLNENWFREAIIPSDNGNTLVDMDIFLSTMIWGGIGGVVAVLYSLFKHVGQRDFDVHYSLSYLGKPFMGLILGATVYMVFNLVIRALGILPAGTEEGGKVTVPVVAPGVMYLVAWASGFKENRIFDLVDQGMKRVFAGGGSASTEPPPG
jgi:hypothetical protein